VVKWLFFSAGLMFWALGSWGIVDSSVNTAWSCASLLIGLFLMAGAVDLNRFKNPGWRIVRDLTINMLVWVVIVLGLLAVFSLWPVGHYIALFATLLGVGVVLLVVGAISKRRA
jgi:hypothetical protein